MKKRFGKMTVGFLLVFYVVGIYLTFLMLFWDMPEVDAAPLDTYQASLKLIRETATEDGANFAAVYNLDGGEGDFANKDSSTVANGGPYHIRSYTGNNAPESLSPGGGWMFTICGGLADNDTFSFTIVGWGKVNGMLQVIAEGDGIIGTQDVVLYPDDSATATNIWWADTINLDETSKWPSVAVVNSGDNEVAAVMIDMTGLEWVQFVIYDADGVGTNANNITVFGRRY